MWPSISFGFINTSGKKPDRSTHSFYTGLLSVRYSPSLLLLTLANSSCVVSTVGHTDSVDNGHCTNSSCVISTGGHTDGVNNIFNSVGKKKKKKVWKGEEGVMHWSIHVFGS